jgi:diguanylate cyclase (GGDEF)-like protein/PAS domain S-box-containing protein
VRDLAPSGADCQVVLVRGEEVSADANDTAIHRPADLPMPHRLTLRRFPAVLSCPLAAVNALDPGAAQPPLGHLLVGASEEVLGRLRGSLEILAVQTAMALTRISLTTEINKRDSELYFRALVQQATDVILIIDEQGIIRYQSPSAGTLLGAPALSGQAVVNLVQPEQLELAVDLLRRMADGQPVPQGLDWTVRAGDGSVLHLAASWRDLRADPTVAGFVVTLRDVTEQRRLEQELTFRAYHDPLTGLPNRALFAEEVAEAELRGCGHSVTGVLFVDLDNFKDVNDTLGHGVGDQLLIAVAARLTAAIRPGDLAARLGGDEFAILVRDATDRKVVEEVADGVLTALSTPVLVERRAIRVSGSIGLATTADSGTADLLHNADQALYSAKQAGKGGWRGYRDPGPAPLRLPTPIEGGTGRP